MELGQAYIERVYAGVLGKIIGVYHGRPVENWNHRDIVARFGEVKDFVAPRLGKPIVVPDDDISGTFTFIKALSDNGNPSDLTPAQVGDTWLNYIIENRAILWWGGNGQSTEHTAFLNLKQGVPAPESGSAARNGTGIAEQIGAQIFIEGFGLVVPGEPERAAAFARIAASVSHDGAAIHGAQVVAAMTAAAFTESDINKLIEIGLSVIPADCVIADVIHEVRAWYAKDRDWYLTRDRIEAKHGGNAWPGGVHMVPNHAVVILALNAGGGDLARSLTIASTAGFDTDCNAANVGCVLGVANGLAGLTTSFDFRTPVNDRLYLPTADGGAAVSDAVQVTQLLVNIARGLAGEEAWQPEDGARFHFSLPGSTQAFVTSGAGLLANDDGALSVSFPMGRHEVKTPVFLTPAETTGMGYGMLASPTLYPGQRIRARIRVDSEAQIGLLVRGFGDNDELETTAAPVQTVSPGEAVILDWVMPIGTRAPMVEVGLGIESKRDVVLHLDWLRWDGDSTVTLQLNSATNTMTRLAWVNGVDIYQAWGETVSLSQNDGTGLVLHGTREWRDYRASATIRPIGRERFGVVVRAQGMRRWYALVANRDGTVALIRRIDSEETVLASVDVELGMDLPYRFSLEVQGTTLRGVIDGIAELSATDGHPALRAGAVGLLVTNGTIHCPAVEVAALT